MYLALYRKYRSKTFDAVIGQKHIINILKNQVLKGEVSHAYLFSGTRGTGKTSVAKILARAVNCLNPQEGNPCNVCESCQGILHDRIMDVVEMDAASNNSVEDIRELKDKVIYPPSMCKYKVYIIDEVHMLSRGAFNALLKILEEPPEHLVFILATTEPERIPQTILSRCQIFNFKRLSIEEIVKNLDSVSKDEERTVDKEVFYLIANNSDGSMRDALSLLDQCFSLDGHISYTDASEILGFVEKDALFNLTDSIINGDLPEALNTVRSVFDSGKDLNQFIKDMLSHFRNLMVSKETTSDSKILIPIDSEKYYKQSSGIELQSIINGIETINDLGIKAKYSQDVRLILEMGIVKLMLLFNPGEESVAQVTEVKAAVKESGPRDRLQQIQPNRNQANMVKRQVESPIKSDIIEEDKSSKTTSDKSSDSSLNIEVIKRDWSKILDAIKSRNRGNISAALIDAELLNYKDSTLYMVNRENYKFTMPKSNIKFLEFILGDFYKEEIEVKLTEKPSDNGDIFGEVERLFGEDNIRIE